MPEAAFLAAAFLHLGFQLTVTVLVYPALGRTEPDAWRTVHARHSRSIAPVVALVYGLLVAAGAWLLASGPSVPDVVAVIAAAGAMAVTAVAAAPTHGRLLDLDARLMDRLLWADRGRLGFAVLAAAAAGLSLLP